MAKETAAARMIKDDYAMVGLDVDETFKKTEIILKIYRKVAWCTGEELDELNEITYESCMGDTETLSYLLNFAPDKEMETFRARAINAMQAKALLDLINKSITKLRTYPNNGKIYYSILNMKYMEYFDFDEAEILEQLGLERSTYYRRKKEATMLLGYILFGIMIPKYIIMQRSVSA